MDMSLSTDPWIINDPKMSVVFTIPYEFGITNNKRYLAPSFHRPAILMFPSKSSAELFKKNMLYSVSNSKPYWTVLGYKKKDDIESFEEVCCEIDIKDVYENTHIPSFDIQTTSLKNVDNNSLMTLTLCSYVLYFYVEHMTYKKLSKKLNMKGFLINPQAQSMNDYDNVKEFESFMMGYVVSYLNRLI